LLKQLRKEHRFFVLVDRSTHLQIAPNLLLIHTVNLSTRKKAKS